MVDKNYSVDTRTGVFKWGMRLKQLSLKKEGLTIDKEETHHGFKRLISNPKFIIPLLSFLIFYFTMEYSVKYLGWVKGLEISIPIIIVVLLLSSYLLKKIPKKPMIIHDKDNRKEKISYKDIIKLNKRKSLVGDIILDLEYKQSDSTKKLSFFAANELNSDNPTTEIIYQILNKLISKK